MEAVGAVQTHWRSVHVHLQQYQCDCFLSTVAEHLPVLQALLQLQRRHIARVVIHGQVSVLSLVSIK